MENTQHICPPWVGKLMVSSLRKMYHNPKAILNEFIQPGYQVVEVGPGMGFFSLPMAKLCGIDGKVYCVDIQQDMLTALDKRAQKANVNQQIITHLSSSESLGLSQFKNHFDFGLLFAVVHEIPNKELLFQELAHVIKPKSKILFAEPKGHVTIEHWNKSLKLAKLAGFEVLKANKIQGSHAAVLEK